jgi:hypothetical protein
MVTPDETGWRVAGRLQWLWAFATRDTTIYRIQPGRGVNEAAAVLGSDFDGVLVRDGRGRKRAADRPETEWVRVPAPELRIVDGDRWHAAHARLAATRETYLRATTAACGVDR